MELAFTYDESLPRRTVTEEDVAAAESMLGVSLPVDFKAFLVAHDGPVVSPGWFPAAGPNGAIWCGPLACILSTEGPLGRGGIGRACCLEMQTLAYRDWLKLPRHYVAIGQMRSHPSTLLISTAAADFAAVYAWGGGDKRFRPDQLARVAGSFSEFLTLLSEPPPDVRARYAQWVHERRTGGQRPPASEYEGPEARRWLRRNRNPTPLAANHFPSADAARRFVDELYAAGAPKVLVPGSSIQADDDGGPYADALVVFLPADPSAREAVCQRCQRELDEPEPIDAADPNPVFLWWD